MRIDSAGNVGIGTTDPGLNIGEQSSFDLAANSATLHIKTTTSGERAQLHLDGYTQAQITMSDQNSSADQKTYAIFHDGSFSHHVNYNALANTTQTFLSFDHSNGNVGIGTTAPANALHISGNSRFNGQMFQRVATAAGVERAVIHKDGIADNTATALFTITTTNESGNTDDGAYTCFIKGMVGHRIDTDAAGNLAVKGYSVAFARCIAGDSSGTNTAVTEIYESAEAGSNLDLRGINSVTTTVAETSEYVQTISITIDDDGSGVDTFEVVFEVEVIWGEFLTPPVITAS